MTTTAESLPVPSDSFGHSVVHRWPAALGVVAAVVFFGDRPESIISFAWVLAGMPVAYLLFGVARGELRGRRALVVQVAGLLAFAAVVAAVLAIGGDLGRYLLAAGWLAHGVWDVVHHRSGRVVPRQWAEWCGVVDILGAAAIAFLPAAG
jgi:hypothetical protein